MLLEDLVTESIVDYQRKYIGGWHRVQSGQVEFANRIHSLLAVGARFDNFSRAQHRPSEAGLGSHTHLLLRLNSC